MKLEDIRKAVSDIKVGSRTVKPTCIECFYDNPAKTNCKSCRTDAVHEYIFGQLKASMPCLVVGDLVEDVSDLIQQNKLEKAARKIFMTLS